MFNFYEINKEKLNEIQSYAEQCKDEISKLEQGDPNILMLEKEILWCNSAIKSMGSGPCF